MTNINVNIIQDVISIFWGEMYISLHLMSEGKKVNPI